MKDKDGNDIVFVMNNEEGEYIRHIRDFSLKDNYPRPNRFNFNSSNIGRFVKVNELNSHNQPPIPNNKLSNLNIHKGHRRRLREMFNNVDPSSMPEHQILELLLSFVQPQKDDNPLAHTLLSEFGSFAAVLDASIEDLKNINGIGEVLASFIHFCSKIPSLYNNSKCNFQPVLSTPADIIDFVRSNVTFSNKEEFYYMCLNNKGNVLCFKNLGIGTSSRLYIDNKVLVKNILRHPTSSVVLCHTHPNGNPNPSNQDKDFTLNMHTLFETMEIKLLDHIILSPSGYYSFFANNSKGIDNSTNLRNRILFNMPSYILSKYDEDK